MGAVGETKGTPRDPQGVHGVLGPYGIGRMGLGLLKPHVIKKGKPGFGSHIGKGIPQFWPGQKRTREEKPGKPG